jgi:hypothetical protein
VLIARTVVQAMLDVLQHPRGERSLGVQMTLPVEVYTAENM